MQMHNLRTQLKYCFPQTDDSNHWLCVIIGWWGLFRTDAQLTELEKNSGIQYTPQFPTVLVVLLPVLWPIAEAEMMKRLNTLANRNA